MPMTTLEACGHRFFVKDSATSGRESMRRLLASVPAMFGDLPMRADLFDSEHGIEIDLGEFGAFVASAGVRGELEVLRWPLRDSLRDEFLFGPVLLSALAQRRIFALHASAFRVGGDDAPVVAVIAPSGTGKSTLARAAFRRGWERLSDDLLPTVVGIDAGLFVLPHFPQLKLPADQQYARDRPARIALGALVVLERSSAIETATLSPRDTMHTVLTSTISSRLFAQAQLQQHLRFATALADASARGALTTLRLRVRNDRDAADVVADEALSVLKSTLAAAAARQ
jgi:hypothetical protein